MFWYENKIKRPFCPCILFLYSNKFIFLWNFIFEFLTLIRDYIFFFMNFGGHLPLQIIKIWKFKFSSNLQLMPLSHPKTLASGHLPLRFLASSGEIFVKYLHPLIKLGSLNNEDQLWRPSPSPWELCKLTKVRGLLTLFWTETDKCEQPPANSN